MKKTHEEKNPETKIEITNTNHEKNTQQNEKMEIKKWRK